MTKYTINDPRGADPHTPAIAPDGRIWFTVQEGNVVGVLDRPRRLVLADDSTIYYSDFARGYLGRLADGIIWYSEAGVHPNTLVRFDRKTDHLDSWPIPSGGGVVRNMAAASDGRLYLRCSGVNKVAVVQPGSRR